MESDLAPHQEEAVGKLRNGNILWGDVGSGKSRAAMAYYARKEAPKNVYVITTAKKRDSLDWEKEGIRFGVLREGPTEHAGLLVVDSWNNIAKYSEVEGAFFIFDEQRLVGSGAWTKSFLKIVRRNSWILLTATPGDTWLDYIPVFVANGFYKNRSAFIAEHVIYNRFSKFPKVDRYTGVNTLVRHKNAILVHMSFVRHTSRVVRITPVEYDEALLEKVWKKRWHVYENRPLRDVAELFLVMRKVVNSDTGRLRSLETLIAKHPRLIVFYNFDYELEILRRLSKSTCETNSKSVSSIDSGPKSPIPKASEPTLTPAGTTSSLRSRKPKSSSVSAATPLSIKPTSMSECGTTTSTTASGFEIAEWNGHKHEPIPTSDRWVYLVQYQAGAEGWNCTATDAMVFYSLTYSYKLWHQAHGRIDRLNTPYSTLYYYVFMSKSIIDSAIWRCLKNKKSFNEAKFVGG